MKVYIVEPRKYDSDWNFELRASQDSNACVATNSKRLAEFIQEKLDKEYDSWKSKLELHRANLNKTS